MLLLKCKTRSSVPAWLRLKDPSFCLCAQKVQAGVIKLQPCPQLSHSHSSPVSQHGLKGRGNLLVIRSALQLLPELLHSQFGHLPCLARPPLHDVAGDQLLLLVTLIKLHHCATTKQNKQNSTTHSERQSGLQLGSNRLTDYNHLLIKVV